MAAPAAPAAGAGIEALAGLLLIVAFVVLLGLQQVWRASIGWLFHKLADLIDVDIGLPHLPSIHPFGFAAHALRAASDNVYAGLGAAALSVERSALWLFHQAARQIRWTGREIASLAHDTLHAVQGLVTAEIPHAVRVATTPLLHRLRGIDHAVGRIEAMARAELRRLRVGIDRLEHRLEAQLGTAVHTLNARVGITARQIRRLARRTTHVERLLGASAFAAATAVALNRLGLRWLRCPSLGRIGRKVGCGGFAFAETLLAETFTAMVALDLCRMALAAQRLVRAIRPALATLILVEGAVCLGGGASLPTAHDAPEIQTTITLPSAHD